ncbi:MAG: phosphatidate cytidylyltransferase [Clostridia bacterium]
MKLKRILSGVIGLPIVALIFIYGNTYIIDVFLGIISIIAMYEYLKCLSVDYKPVKWIAYIPCLLIPFLHVIPKEYLLTICRSSISIDSSTTFYESNSK